MELTSIQKVQFVAKEIGDYRKGKNKDVFCPYCGSLNKSGELCCATLGNAMKAVLDYDDVEKNIRTAEKIAEAIHAN